MPSSACRSRCSRAPSRDSFDLGQDRSQLTDLSDHWPSPVPRNLAEASSFSKSRGIVRVLFLIPTVLQSVSVAESGLIGNQHGRGQTMSHPAKPGATW
jgi:hypothetical protein